MDRERGGNEWGKQKIERLGKLGKWKNLDRKGIHSEWSAGLQIRWQDED